MGATRRLNHYDASMGWQGLFIVAGFGALIIVAGVMLQILQFAVSIKQRNQNRDITGDPWNGRTLEWSTTSPAPEYNFAIIPRVSVRDAFWQQKKLKQQPETGYKPIEVPKNTPIGLYIGLLSLVTGFAVIWHMYWVVPFGCAGLLICIIARTFDEQNTRTISVDEIKRIEAGRGGTA